MRFEPFENMENFLEDVGMFEAAVQPTQVELSIPQLNSVLVVLDGSGREETAQRIGARIAQAHQISLESMTCTSSAEDIIQKSRETGASLVIIPLPLGCGADMVHEGNLGSAGEMLVVESPVPLLCLRQTLSEQQIERALAHIIVPVAIHDHGSDLAASWAFALLGSGGHIEMQAVADVSVIEDAKHYLRLGQTQQDAFDADVILKNFMQDLAGLTSAVQHAGRERRVHVTVSTQTGQFVKSVVDRANSQPTLMVWGMDHRFGTPQYHRGVDLVLGSTGPVLLV